MLHFTHIKKQLVRVSVSELLRRGLKSTGIHSLLVLTVQKISIVSSGVILISAFFFCILVKVSKIRVICIKQTSKNKKIVNTKVKKKLFTISMMYLASF